MNDNPSITFTNEYSDLEEPYEEHFVTTTYEVDPKKLVVTRTVNGELREFYLTANWIEQDSYLQKLCEKIQKQTPSMRLGIMLAKAKFLQSHPDSKFGHTRDLAYILDHEILRSDEMVRVICAIEKRLDALEVVS